MSEELVSIIIPCFQQGRFLQDCIKSLQSQSYTSWEALIVNDGSTDETEMRSSDLIQTECRIRYFYKSNGGASSARNFALSLCRGKYIQFLDPDDKLEFNKLSHQVQFLDSNPLINMVYGNALYFTDGASTVFRKHFYDEDSGDDWIEESALDKRSIVQKILEKNIFPICAPLFRKIFVDRVGMFDESLTHHEDWDYFLRAAIGGMQAVYQPGLHSNAFIRTHSNSLSQNRAAMAESMLEIRVRIHPALTQFAYKRTNLVNMMGLLGAIDKKIVILLSEKVYSTCVSPKEKVIFYILRHLSHGGALHFLVMSIVPHLPLMLLRLFGISKSASQALKRNK
jgi:glycosyltransferase involved in cell wall biosynthesis